MSETGGPNERDSEGAAPTQGHEKLTHRGRAVILGAHSAILLACLPVLLLTVAFSLFEGGDLALKSRLQAWALFAIWGNLACAVVVGSTAVRYYRGQPVSRGLVRSASGLLLGLAAGWAWVYQGQLMTDPSVLCLWVGLTTPTLIAFAAPRWHRTGRKQLTA